MADDVETESQRARLGPEAVARQTFGVARKGFDQVEVRSFLANVAEELREARDREAALRTKVSSLEALGKPPIELDEDTLIAALGEETAHVLTAAREAAAQIRAKGEESVARLLREATDDAHRMRLEAETALASKLEAVELEVAALRAEGEAVVEEMLADAEAKQAEARAYAERVRAKADADAAARAEQAQDEAAEVRARADDDAAGVIARATEEGRSMVNEALAVRERVLKDLNRKRRAARAQLEQLGAGRDRLLEAYDVVRRAMDEATGELEAMLPEAKQAADAARLRVAQEPEQSLESLIAEVEREEPEPEPEPDLEPDSQAQPEPEPEPEPAADVVRVREPARAPTPPPAPAPRPPVVVEVVEVEVVEVEVDVVEAPPEIVVVVEPDPEPAPEPEPERAPEPEPEREAVRLPRKLRGRRGFQLEETELTPVDPQDPMEEVRVVASPAPKPAPEPPAADGNTSADAGDADQAGGAEASVAEEPVAEESVDVDALFARLRSSRQVDVAKAKEVLADEPPADAPPEPEAVEPEPEPEPEPESDRAVAAAAEPQVQVDVEVEPEDEPGPNVRPRDDEALLERRDAVTDRVEQRVIRRLRRSLADEQNEVLDHLRRTRGADVASVLPPLDDQVARYASGAAPELAAAAEGGAAFFGGDPSRASSVEDLASDLAIAIVVPLRDRLEKSLRDTGGDEDTVADVLRACYREWKSHRLAVEAHHVVLAAFNRALYEATDSGTQQRWLVDDGGSPCPDAEDNALAGLVVRGEPFPTGHCFPPAHPGCRCLLVPVAPEVG